MALAQSLLNPLILVSVEPLLPQDVIVESNALIWERRNWSPVAKKVKITPKTKSIEIHFDMTSWFADLRKVLPAIDISTVRYNLRVANAYAFGFKTAIITSSTNTDVVTENPPKIFKILDQPAFDYKLSCNGVNGCNHFFLEGEVLRKPFVLLGDKASLFLNFWKRIPASTEEPNDAIVSVFLD